MGYSEKDELRLLTRQAIYQSMVMNRGRYKCSGLGFKFKPSMHECPFCHKEFEGVPKWCPHCRKRVTVPGTCELIELNKELVNEEK